MSNGIGHLRCEGSELNGVITSYETLVAELAAPCMGASLGRYIDKAPKNPSRLLRITEGIKPVDLYTYLYGRFGTPNGFQNALRQDHSENLIHWHYTLHAEGEAIEIMAMTYRIELWFPEAFCFSAEPASDFVSALKADFSHYGKEMSAIRKSLERWVMFINPYYRLRSSIDRMLLRAQALQDAFSGFPHHPVTSADMKLFEAEFSERADKFDEHFGLALSIRMLAPVMAEAFVNLVIYVLGKADVKSDTRVYDSVKRANIDVRVRALHLYCERFQKPVNYESEACKDFQTMMNGRNELLHGNVEPETTYHEEIFFDDTVPLFVETKDFYSRSFGHREVHSIEKAEADIEAVDALINEVLSCLSSSAREEMKLILETQELGFNRDTKRIGILFSGVLFDGFMVGKDSDGNEIIP